MKKLRVLIIILLTIFSIGCRRHCPAFPENFLVACYPYKEGEVKKFKNTAGDILLLYINGIWKTEKESIRYGYDQGCSLQGHFNGYIKNNNDSISVMSTIYLSTNYSIRFIPENAFWSLYFSGEIPEEVISKNLNKAEMYIPDIIEMEFRERDDMHPSYYAEYLKVKRVKIEKHKGITEITLRDTIWTLVE